MTDETKQQIQLQLTVLKQTMKDRGVILAIGANKSNLDKSIICFIDKDKYLTEGKLNGISVSLADFNDELLQEG